MCNMYTSPQSRKGECELQQAARDMGDGEDVPFGAAFRWPVVVRCLEDQLENVIWEHVQRRFGCPFAPVLSVCILHWLNNLQIGATLHVRCLDVELLDTVF